MTYQELYQGLCRELTAAGVENERLEARELLCAAARMRREDFFRDRMTGAPEETAAALAELKKRRLDGEPLAYLTGEWEFYGLTLKVTPAVLIPRIDTEVLADLAITEGRKLGRPVRILDLCTGSGCIGLAAASHLPESEAVLCDLSPAALAVAEENVVRCGLAGRVRCVRADARQDPPAGLGTFDLLVCNPPYIPAGDIGGLDKTVRAFEPHMALDGGADGLDFYRDITRRWKDVLKPDGLLFYEVGIGQGADVAGILAENGFSPKISRDTQDIDRVVWGCGKPERYKEGRNKNGG